MRKRLTEVSKHSCVLILFTVMALVANAQQTVKGRVTDSKDGSALAGVTIAVKGTNIGTQTAADGSFEITAPANSGALVVTAVGFMSQEVAIGQSPINISMQIAAATLSDVVIIGYGTARKKDLTGSIATVTSKDFQKGNITTPEQMIAGKIAGVSIISNSGQPGAGSTIRIRGGSSLQASNDPLFVIDGVPLDNDAISGAGNPLSFINTNDIESFTVLKDASAAAIYGTRAANGVIIITTKKGLRGKLKIGFSSVNSVSSVNKKADVLNANQVRTIVNANGTAAQKAMIGTASTDWQSLIYQTAFATDNNISISGGIKFLPYRISVGFQSQDGVLKTDNLRKTSLAVVLNPTFFDNHLKVDINLKGSLEQVRFANKDAIGGAVSFDPTQPVRVNNKRYNGYFEWVDSTGALINLAGKNPVGLLNQKIDKGKPQRSIGNIQFDYKFHFLPDLHANLNLGYDISKGTGTVFVSDSAAADYRRGGRSTHYKQTKQNTLLEFYLNYISVFNSIKSRVDLTAGYSYNNYLTTVYNFADYNAHGIKIPNSDPAFDKDKPEHNLISFFGRANYAYNDRYLLTATLRRDGSSRFSPDNRWGLFPSIALAWKIKNESFLQNSTVFSDLKIRLGYGITGQQDGIGNYDYLSYYALSNTNASYQFGEHYYQGFRPGGFYADRKWEETATSNIGLDFGFLDNRISGTLDLYLKKTSNLLNKIPQPAGANFSAFIVANVGDMENKGLELNLNTQPVQNNSITWDVGFNLTYNKNTITNLTVIPHDKNYPGFPSGTIAGGIGGQFAFINAVGGSKNTFNLYKQVYDSLENPIEGVFVDRNGDGIINQNDLFTSKRADPDVFLGFSTNIIYKKWNAGFVLRASFGNYVYNNTYSQTGILNQVLGNAVIYNASANYLATKFKGNSSELLSDYYIQNASFLKMDNLNIGYNAGTVYHNAVRLRLNAYIQNVFVITKYKGIDPEISSGIDYNFYPRSRVFALGLNLDF